MPPPPPGWPGAPPSGFGPPLEPEPPAEVPWTLGDILLSLVVGVVGGVVLGAFAMLAAGADTDRMRTFDVTVFSTVAYVWIVAMFWYFNLRRHRASVVVLFGRRLSFGKLAALLGISFGALILSGTITQLVLHFTGLPEPPREQFIRDREAVDYINWVMLAWTACVCAPVAEEFVFRGVMFGYLRKRWPWFPAAAVPAALFAMAHPIPIMWPAFFALGLVLAAMREWMKTLLAPILLHAMYNGFVLLVLYTIVN
jgi:membrane protease YdiL (CAAX protease family)